MMWIDLFMGIINFFIKNKDKGKEVIETLEKTVNNIKENSTDKKYDILTKIDLSRYRDEEYLNPYDVNKKTIILVDDLPATKVLYEIAFNEIKRIHKVDVTKDYNIIFFFGKNVGFSVIKFLNKDINIDYAILDITIDTLAKFDDEYIELDGVDIAIAIANKNATTKIMFNSAHTMNPRNLTVSEFIEKYKKHFKDDMYKHTIDKLVDMNQAIYNFLFKG